MPGIWNIAAPLPRVPRQRAQGRAWGWLCRERGGIFPYKRHPSRVGAGVTAARHRPFSFPLPGLFRVRPKAALCPGSWPCLGLTRCLSPPERDGGESIIPHACRNASVPGISPPRLPQPDSFHREIFSPAVRALEVQHPRGFPAGRQLRPSKEYSRSCFSTQGRSERSPLTFTGTFACSWPADSCRCGTTDVRGLSAPLLHRNIRAQARA